MDHLVAQRAGHKGKVTKTINDIDALLIQDCELENSDIIKLKVAKETLIKQNEKIQSKNIEIMSHMVKSELENESITKEVMLNEDFESEIDKYLILISNKLKSEINTHDDVNGSKSQSAMVENSSIKLEAVKIPSFGGDPTTFQPFYQSFMALVDCKPISGLEKLALLKNNLFGEAQRSVEMYGVLEENYQPVLQQLARQFGRTQIIVSAYINNLIDLPIVSSIDDVSKLRNLYDKVESNVRGLLALNDTTTKSKCQVGFSTPGASFNSNVSSDSDSFNNSTVLAIIQRKLPRQINHSIAKECSNDNVWCLSKVLTIFRNEVEALEMVYWNSTLRIGGTSAKEGNRSTSANNMGMRSTAVGLTNVSRSQVVCTYCGQSHRSMDCDRHKTVEARKAILKRDRRCFMCLRAGHNAWNCVINKVCFRCHGRHHVSICSSRGGATHKGSSNTGGAKPYFPPSLQNKGNTNVAINNLNENHLHVSKSEAYNQDKDCALSTLHSSGILLQTAIGKASNPCNSSLIGDVRILFDLGSHRTYCTNFVIDKLKLRPSGQESINVCTFGSTSTLSRNSDVCKLTISGPDGQVFITALSVPIITAPITRVQCSLSSLPHLSGLTFADPELFSNAVQPISIDVLGSDHFWDFFSAETILGKPSAMRSILGWVLSGPIDGAKSINNNNYCSYLAHDISSTKQVDFSLPSCMKCDDVLTKELHKFWQYENLEMSEGDVLQEFEANIKFLESKGQYSVSLPLKPNLFSTLPDNLDSCKAQLLRLYEKLSKCPEQLIEYHNIFQEQLKHDIIEVVPDPSVSSGIVHYLPHHPVYKPDSVTTKTRIVFNGSSKRRKHDLSLNDCLLPGPSLIQNLISVLLRFRCYTFVLIGDLEKAFLKIYIDERDRDCCRFLWFKDLQNLEVRVLRNCRALFGLTPSPFLLNGTIHHHVQLYSAQFPVIVARILESMYVDDMLSGGFSCNEVVKLYDTSRKIFNDAGMRLRKFVTNSDSLMQHIEEYQQVSSVKVLGSVWHPSDDMLSYNFGSLFNTVDEKDNSKRALLSFTAKLYDPTGMLSPVIVMPKIMFQELCKSKVDWSDPLPPELQNDWNKFKQDMSVLKDFEYPRCVLPKDAVLNECTFELHAYCDASVKAIAAAVYLRVVWHGKVKVSLMMSKSKVAPLHKLSISRKELLSCVMAAKLIKFVESSLTSFNISNLICWTDSLNALYWIVQEGGNWKPFVYNRVAQIYKFTSPDCWRHVPGIINPSDIASRGALPSELVGREVWWKGPKYLCEDECSWPKQPGSISLDEEGKIEVNKSCILTTVSSYDVKGILNFSNFSTVSHLIRILAYVQLFIDKLKSLHTNKIGVASRLTAARLQESKAMILKSVQLEAFSNELSYLQGASNKPIPPLVKSLQLFIDSDGLLKCRGRIENSLLRQSSIYPILLPKLNYITSLVIKQAHAEVLHSGIQNTLAQVREQYWLPQGRQRVKCELQKCLLCRKVQGKSYKIPDSPPLPPFRVSCEHAFNNIGLDYAGPLYIKSSAQKGDLDKVYCLLITCSVTRAIHLELTWDLSLPSFLNAFRRFCARRGYPSCIWSDNFKTFKGAARQINSILKQGSAEIEAKGITWDFIVERAAWWGGYWERLVQVVKQCLKKVCGSALLSYDELATVMAEAEACINSRPLTYLSSDLDSELICPAHFLTGTRLTSPPQHTSPKELMTLSDVKQRLRYCEVLKTHYWRRFKREYLVSLRENYKSFNKNNSSESVKIGDVCLVEDQGPRLKWKFGLVEDTIVGRDNVIRAAVVKVRGNNGFVTLRRPLQQLYPLEIRS